MYVPGTTGRPAASRTVTDAVTSEPGTYEAASSDHLTEAAELEPTRTATGVAETVDVPVDDEFSVSWMFAVPAATPTRLHETAPAMLDTPQSVYELLTAAVLSETA